MRFHYRAYQLDGKIIEGTMEAATPAEALAYLGSRGLKPVSLKIAGGIKEKTLGKVFKKSISVSDKIFLTKYLSLMLKVGTDLFKAIGILVEDFDKPAIKALLLEIRSNLEKGNPFYTTFAKYPKYFSPVFVNLIKAGEASGNLERVLGELSVSLEKENDLRHKIKSALIYPIILVFLSIAILILLISVVLPKIANVFMSGGIQPPLFSKIVFTVGIFVNQYIWFFLGILIILGAGGWYFFSNTLIGRKISHHFVAKLPVVSRVLEKMALQRFASTFSSLLRAGLPILDSLEITAQVTGFEELKSALIRISREGVAKGLLIGDAFRRETIFPRVVVNLIAISEKAGHIEDILMTLADFYEAEVESSVKVLVSFLEPVLLLGIGVIIGTIALSIIMPVYQLVGAVSQF
ncbi:type II secretion system F family protein [Candidatus Wolfebacteria bacterium]|nr:type II secretion system F family protein [Candidatus Wolfebacteria bacterium]